MSAKFIHTLSDENPDLQKQIGCMNGIFHLFDRHHFLGGGRRITGQNHKRLPAGQNGNHSIEAKSTSQGKNQKKSSKEKQRVSTESSRTSFSSTSCSSSLSSLECNRASQLEPCSFNQSIGSETRGRDLPSPIHQPMASFKSSQQSQPMASFKSSQQSPDLRDVIKDSIYREARGLLVKTVSKGESGGQTLKYFDSPRPLQQPKSGNTKVSGLKESYRVHKLHEEPRKSIKEKLVSSTSRLKDARRFSCDGRESREAYKSAVKIKELPRLSLDSRAGSIGGSTTAMKSSDPIADMERGNRNFSNFLNQQEPESHTRLSNVVAKLMGLEALPGSMSANENQIRHIEAHTDAEKNPFLGSSGTTDKNKQNQIPGSPRHLHKDPISPRLRNSDPVKKQMVPNTKFPIETAPWRHPDGSRSSETPVMKSRITPPKSPNTPLSVYGEIEKKLAQLEFRRSGTDLRALKQILEAMQKSREILETKNDGKKLGTQASTDGSVHQNSELSNLHNLQSNSPSSNITKGTSSPKSCKSPIVIMKPAKLIKASNPASSISQTQSSSVQHGLQITGSEDGRKESMVKQSAKGLTPKANCLRDRSSLTSHPMDKNSAARLARTSKASREPQSTTRENSGKCLATRQPQKKIGQPRPTMLSPDSVRTQRQSDRRPTESGSPRSKLRPKSANLTSGDELSDIGSYARDLSHQGDTISLQSESTISLASQIDEEVSSTDKSNKINNNFIQQAHQRRKNTVARSMKDRSIAETVSASSEQPSPVSVLDATFYSDDLPSPIKKKPITFKEDENEWNSGDLNHSSSIANSSLQVVINHRKLENMHLLIQNLTQMLSAQEETVNDEITANYNSTNPDHQCISEILLASGLLRDFESGFTSSQFQQTGYPINPQLFLALEQAKSNITHSNDKECRTKTSQSEHIKIERKLVFDAVNEILACKLRQESSSKHWHSPNMLADIRPRGQQLLGELCSEVDRMQENASSCSLDDENDSLRNILQADLMHQSAHWTTFSSEIPWLVLDVERLIFKDLISEVVTGVAIGLQVPSAGYCRQLFSN